jgi:hypothetical protein
MGLALAAELNGYPGPRHAIDLANQLRLTADQVSRLTALSTQQIGEAQAALRAAHLKYHLATVAILTPEQVKRYGESRGYAGGGAQNHHPMQ